MSITYMLTVFQLVPWGETAEMQPTQGAYIKRPEQMTYPALKAAIRKGSFNLEMAQASSNCLYLSKCGITKGYLLQSYRDLQLAQRLLKNFNSYKVLLSVEAVKLGRSLKQPAKLSLKC